MLRNLFILILTLCLSGAVLAQTEVILDASTDGSTVTSCDVILYDSGGPNDNYQNNEDYSITICSDNGDVVNVLVNMNTENTWDELLIFDGANDGAPLLNNGSTDGVDLLEIQGTTSCLTFVFSSDGSVTRPGFEITFSCGELPPPPPIPGCADSNPFCNETNEPFPNSVDTPSPAGDIDFGCLFTQPNPVWYYFETAEAGDIEMTIAQETAAGNGLDIDFIAWGPFETLESGCTQLNAANEVDCSYAIANVEVANFPDTEVGETYIMLLTNFSNSAGIIDFGQTGGTGEADCDILIPCPTPTVDLLDASCDLCNGTVTIEADSEGPYVFSWVDASGTAVVSTDDAVAGSSSLSDLCPGSYFFTVTDVNDCVQEGEVIIANASSPPTASLSGEDSFCEGESADLSIVITDLGAGPATVSYTLDGVAMPDLLIGSSPFTLAVDEPGEYVLTTVSANGCTGSVSGSITVEEIPQITVNTVTETCTDFSYVVSFAISGGDSDTYNVSAGGTLSGSTFTSDPIASGTAYSFTVSDASGCGDVVVAGTVDCPCAAAGEISGSAGFCPGESSELEVALEGTGPWTIEVERDGQPYDTFTTGITPFVFNVTDAGIYTLASVSDAFCTGDATGVVIVAAYELPSVTISGDSEVCVGELAEIVLSITASGDWTVEYSVDGSAQAPIIDNDILFQTVALGGQLYEVTSVSDDFCTNTIPVTFEVDELPSPTAELTGNGAICADEQVELLVTFEGNAPYTLTLSENGLPQAPIIVTADTYTFIGTDGVTYGISTLSDDLCAGTVSGEVIVDQVELPQGTLSGGGAICEGESVDVSLIFGGSGTYTFDLLIDGVPQEEITTTDNPYIIDAEIAGTYSSTIVTDDNCQGVMSGVAEVTINEAPSAVLSGSSIVCDGDNAQLDLALTGTAPWTVSYSLDGGPPTDVNINSIFDVFTVSEAGSYELVDVSDDLCPGEAIGSGEVEILPLPTISFDGTTDLCAGQEAVFIDLMGSGDFTLFISDGLSAETVTETSPTLTWPIADEGAYSITLLFDELCTADAEQTLDLIVHPLPTVSVMAPDYLCAGSSAEIDLSLTGGGAYTIDYSFDNSPSAPVDILGDDGSIEISEAGEYAITGLSDQFCTTLSDLIIDIPARALPEASISGDATICANAETALSIVLEGEDPWELTHTIDGLTQEIIQATTSPFVVLTGEEGVHEIQTVTDSFCSNTGVGSAEVTYFPSVSVEVSPAVDICLGTSTSVVGSATGGQGIGIESSWSAGGSLISEADSIVVGPSVSTDYVYTAIDECGISYTATSPVTVRLQPPLSIESENVDVCGSGRGVVVNTTPQEYRGSCEWIVLQSGTGLSIDTIVSCGDLDMEFSSQGFYDVTLSMVSPFGCASDSTFSDVIRVLPVPRAEWSYLPEEPTVLQNRLTFFNQTADAVDFSWSIKEVAEQFSSQEVASYTFPTADEAQWFDVCQVSINEYGCTDTLCRPIYFDTELIIWVPTAFTPGTDRLNDSFKPTLVGVEVEDYLFRIYDRQGKMVWETREVNQGWNGRGADSEEFYSANDVYVWQIITRRIDSTDKIEKSGSVTILR